MRPFRLTIPIDLCPSKKNSVTLVKKNGRIKPAPTKACANAEMAIRVLGNQTGHRGFGKQEVEMRVVWDVQEAKVHIQVEAMGPAPPRGKGKTGRHRDVINLPAIIADALQRVAYHDDRQIKRLVVERV